MQAQVDKCQHCGKPHIWDELEAVHRSFQGLPPPGTITGPLRDNVPYRFLLFRTGMDRDAAAEVNAPSWGDYYGWLVDHGQTVSPKGRDAVTNYTQSGRRREVDMAWCDRVFFDCDNGITTWHDLSDTLSWLGIPAIFHESSSSIRKKTAGKIPLNSTPKKWHVEIPLAKRIPNPLHGLDPQDPEHRYQREEWKRKYRHAATIFGTMTGFRNVGGECGFDLTTSQMCQLRFLGSRQVEGGPTPQIWKLDGNRALDWEVFLAATGYQPAERPKPKAPPQPIRLATGEVVSLAPDSSYDLLAAEVCKRLKIEDFLAEFWGITNPDSGRSHYHCPVHNDRNSPDPNPRGFNVWYSTQYGKQLYKCLGDCAHTQHNTAGDVIKLASLAWGISWTQALKQLATRVGLNPDDYKPRIVRARRPVPEQAPPAPAPVQRQAPPAPDPDPEQPDPTPPPSPRRPRVPRPSQRPPRTKVAHKLVQQKKLHRVEKWAWDTIKVEVLLGSFPGPFLRAISKVLLIMGIPVETVAVTLHKSVSSEYPVFEDVLAEVLDVSHKLQNGEGGKLRGKGWIKKFLGSPSLYELAVALTRDAQESGLKVNGLEPCLPSVARVLIGFNHVAEHGTYLMALHNRLKKEHELEIAEAKAQGKRSRWDSVLKKLKKPCGCGAFFNVPRGSIQGDFTDHKRMILCNSVLCGYCWMLKCLAERECVEELWKQSLGIKGDLSKDTEKRLSYVEVTGIPDEQGVEDLKKHQLLSHAGRLSLVGYENGKPKLLFVTDVMGSPGRFEIRANLWRHGLPEHLKSRVKVKTVERVTAFEVLEMAFAYRFSWHTHARGLMEDRTQEGRFVDWLEWSVNRQTARSTNDKVPWPGKQTLNEYVKEKRAKDENWTPLEDLLLPGEVLTWGVEHGPSGIMLGNSPHPFTLSQAMSLHDVHPAFVQERLALAA